jgi:AcrR family transcriptional regulator
VPKKRLTRAERQALTRREVLDAAARVFPARGYHQTRVEEVADDAGLSIGAVYSNFESKADLFLALYEQHVERWLAELEQRVLEGETPAERTAAAGRWWADFMNSE